MRGRYLAAAVAVEHGVPGEQRLEPAEVAGLDGREETPHQVGPAKKTFTEHLPFVSRT